MKNYSVLKTSKIVNNSYGRIGKAMAEQLNPADSLWLSDTHIKVKITQKASYGHHHKSEIYGKFGKRVSLFLWHFMVYFFVLV